MGRAMAAALIAKGVCLGPDILVVDPDVTARDRSAKLKCGVQSRIDALISDASLVLLAVKPQTADEMYSELRPHLRDGQVVVSIMAGVTLAALKKGLGHKSIVRAMPNTPAQVGLGMNVYFAAPEVASAQLKAVEGLLGACGETMAVDTEDAIDAATAISGSGPAYVFFLAEHWMNAAGRMGFSPQQAETLIQQTLIGATALWKDQGVPPGALRIKVTSKGGTTAAAMETFEKNKIGEGFEKGLQSAYQRAKELGR